MAKPPRAPSKRTSRVYTTTCDLVPSGKHDVRVHFRMANNDAEARLVSFTGLCNKAAAEAVRSLTGRSCMVLRDRIIAQCLGHETVDDQLLEVVAATASARRSERDMRAYRATRRARPRAYEVPWPHEPGRLPISAPVIAKYMSRYGTINGHWLIVETTPISKYRLMRDEIAGQQTYSWALGQGPGSHRVEAMLCRVPHAVLREIYQGIFP